MQILEASLAEQRKKMEDMLKRSENEPKKATRTQESYQKKLADVQRKHDQELQRLHRDVKEAREQLKLSPEERADNSFVPNMYI